jgi:hypothetical protein
MNLAEFKNHLRQSASNELRFQLPDGRIIDAHAHITEVGRVDKIFVDCGGTVRTLSSCVLQSWVADGDVEHRLSPEKLADILVKAAGILREDDLPVEIEYQDSLVSQFPIIGATTNENALIFTLGIKHTDCLAREVCAAQPAGCCAGGGC